jgi:hypothetical protein
MAATAPLTTARQYARPLAWGLVAIYALLTSGLPLPLVATAPSEGSPAARHLAAKDRSQPFPCMDKPCGCATAEQCFTNCCCHTPAETLAWARSHRLAPHILAALERRAGADRSAPDAGSCCAAKAIGPLAKPACCSAVKPAAEAGDTEVCRDYQSLAAEIASAAGEPQAEGQPAGRARVVTLRAMLACGGIVSGWLAVGVALPPPRIVTCERAAEPCGTTVLCNVIAMGVRSAPDAPPPRA